MGKQNTLADSTEPSGWAKKPGDWAAPNPDYATSSDYEVLEM